MRSLPVITCAAAGVIAVSPALAQPQTGQFTWQVSRDGLDWSSSLTLAPGDPYHIRGVASWTDGPTTSVGFAGCTFDQIDLIGANATDTFGGASGAGGVPTYTTRMQGVAETWTLLAGSGASEAGLKIDNLAGLGRTNLGQIAYVLGGGIPNPAFKFDNPVVLLRMTAVAGDAKTLTISAAWTRLGTPASNEFKVYTTVSGTNKKPVQEATMTSAVVTIIPAPAPLALGLASLLLPARRNRP